ncbi:RdRp P1/P2 fusion protein [Black pepper virus E]|nr:RdRp P1/P2 fusion protein [Black pepper virus E]
MASSLIMTAATLLLLLSLASLFFGATPFQLSGSPPSLLKPSDSPVVFCSCALPDAYPDSGRLPPDLELHSPNLTQGTGAARVSHSRTLPFSPVISIGQWLRLDMRNTTFRITIQVTRPQLPEVTLPNLNDYRGQVALWYSTVLAAMLGRLTLCLSWLTDFFGAVFRVVETVVIVSLYWTVVLFWRCVLSSPFRMAVWLVTPCVLFCTWGMTCVNLPVRIAAGIVTAPILTLYFCCVVFLRCVGRFTRLTRNITTSCMSWVSSTRTKTVQSLRTLPTSATSTFAQMRNLKSGGEAQVIPGRDNFTAGWERAVPLPNAQSPLELHAAPPKRCIGSCLDKNRKHVGYFTLVKLMGGGVGVIAPFHVLDDTEYISGRDASMSLEQLTQVYEDTKGDLAIFTGPASMGSLLGMKAVPLLCADMVRKSQVSLYTERDGGWRVQSASIVGAQDGFLAVVSQTLPGDSGLPLFDQRNRVVAIHVGHFGSRRVENMASVVLPVPGLTAPDYAIYKPVGETLYVADRVFEIAERLEAGQAREIWVGGKQWKTVIGSSSIAVLRNPEFDHSAGKLGAWGDIEDDEVAPEPAHFEKATSGKRISPEHTGKTKRGKRRKPSIVCNDGEPGYLQRRPPPQAKEHSKWGEEKTGITRRAHGADVPRAALCLPGEGEGCPSRTPQTQECGQATVSLPLWKREGESSSGGSEGYLAPVRHDGTPEGSGEGRREEGGQYGPVPTSTEPPPAQTCQAPTDTAIGQLFNGFYRWRSGEEIAPGFRAVGSCGFTAPAVARKEISEWGRARVATSDLLQEACRAYDWPDTGALAELSSLRYQAARRASASEKALPPSEDARRRVIQRTTEVYAVSECVAPLWSATMDREHALLSFIDAVRGMKPDAGSGVPYAAFHGRKTHEDWCFDVESFYSMFEHVWARLLRLSRVNEFPGPVQAVQAGLCDPIRIFVKPEPHKREKIEQKRFRLIASVSIADQLVARMLFGPNNARELEVHMDIPSKPGLGFSQDSQVLPFTESVASLAGTTPEDLVNNWSRYVIPTDCSGFDWSVPMWLLEDEMAVRNALTRGASETLVRMRDAWLKCLGNSVFCLSNGLLLAQETPGIQKSGSFLTSSSNSRMRYMASLFAGAPWAVTMGDDALEGVGADLSQYALLGFKCERAEELDFCSHLFKAPSVVIPKNIHKMIFGLLSGVSPQHREPFARLQWQQAFQSISEEMRHMPQEFWLEFLNALGMSWESGIPPHQG